MSPRKVLPAFWPAPTPSADPDEVPARPERRLALPPLPRATRAPGRWWQPWLGTSAALTAAGTGAAEPSLRQTLSGMDMLLASQL